MKTQKALPATLFFIIFVIATAFSQRLMKDFIGTNMENNEEDTHWWEKKIPEKGENNANTPIAQMLPDKYGAMLSAVYDGGCKSMALGDKTRIKNTTTQDAKVIPAEVIGLRGQYLIDMIKYFEKTRRNGCPVLPFDALNFRHYVTETPDGLTPENIFYRMYGEYAYPSYHSGSVAVSPEESKLRWMVEETIERIMNSYQISNTTRSELQQKEIWFSEFGYSDKSEEARKRFPIIGDDGSWQKTQAQWIVRAYLELVAVEVHGIKIGKAMVFGGEDKQTGLDNYTPNKAWYHVQTMRNVLGKTSYYGEYTKHRMTHISGGELSEVNARIRHYKGDYKGQHDVDILVIWSPNATGGKGALAMDIQDIFPNCDYNELTIITPRDGDEDGYHQTFDIHNGSFTFDANTVPVSETPMYVVLGK